MLLDERRNESFKICDHWQASVEVREAALSPTPLILGSLCRQLVVHRLGGFTGYKSKACTGIEIKKCSMFLRVLHKTANGLDTRVTEP